METTLIFLIFFPFVVSLALLINPVKSLRNLLVRVSALAIIGASIYLMMNTSFSDGPIYYSFESELLTQAMLAIEIALAIYILYISLKFSKYSAVVLVLLQSAVILYFESAYGHDVTAEHNLFIDQLSLIMGLIVGIVGSLICIYAIGYMQDFHHHHKDIKDHQNLFFFVMFAFLSGMFGLVFSNNILWLYFFWEITTICSFILIGYTRTAEAWNNAFTALIMNLVGGLCFATAIFYLGTSAGGIIELSKLMEAKDIALLPAILISVAGFAKAAQIPFSSWLVGAMIAPTPVSALLHSSTMVKAGVYIIVRVAPILNGETAGLLVALVGAVTFLLASGIAISQSNAKKVLAYSTIANLGLIVTCAGLGTYEAIWAAILLIIFHAISKSLLFLAVGTVEHRTGSRDIEDMNGLIVRMPKVAVMILIGISGMFLAPFGMLISKWAALRAFVDASPVVSPILIGIIAYGSAITVFFWTKWMGRLVSVTHIRKVIEDKVRMDEWVALYSLTILTVAVCGLFPKVSEWSVEPYVKALYGLTETVFISQDNMLIMAMMLGIVLLLPLSLFYYSRPRKKLPIYLCGRPATGDMRFEGSLGRKMEIDLSNYYLQNYFGEGKLNKIGIYICVILIACMFIVAIPAGVIA